MTLVTSSSRLRFRFSLLGTASTIANCFYLYHYQEKILTNYGRLALQSASLITIRIEQLQLSSSSHTISIMCMEQELLYLLPNPKFRRLSYRDLGYATSLTLRQPSSIIIRAAPELMEAPGEEHGS